MNYFVFAVLIILVWLALSHPLGADAKAIVKKVENAAVKDAKKAVKVGKKVGKKLAKKSTWQKAYTNFRRNPTINHLISNVTHSNAYRNSSLWWKKNIHF